MIHLSEAD